MQVLAGVVAVALAAASSADVELAFAAFAEVLNLVGRKVVVDNFGWLFLLLVELAAAASS